MQGMYGEVSAFGKSVLSKLSRGFLAPMGAEMHVQDADLQIDLLYSTVYSIVVGRHKELLDPGESSLRAAAPNFKLHLLGSLRGHGSATALATL